VRAFCLRLWLPAVGVLLDPLNGRRPDGHGIYWLRHDRQLYAIKRYGRRAAVDWLGGKNRRLDARWRRLDAILSKIAGG